MPKEPLAPDGTLLHGIERIWAYAAQNDGYYPLIAIPSSLSDVYYGNTFLRLRDLNACLFKRYDPHSHQSMLKIVGPSRVCNFLWAARSRLIDVGGDSVTK